LRDIGQHDDPPETDEGSMIEKIGTGIEEAEVEAPGGSIGEDVEV